MDIYYVNGEYVNAPQATISVNDLSVLRGFGVFDFLRTYNRNPFHLDEHLQRLERSARLIGLRPPLPISEMKGIIHEGLNRSTHPECNIRIVLTGGSSSDGITPGDAPQLLVMITSVSKLPAEAYSHGAKIITSHVERFLPGAKSINYIPAILCQREARAQGAIESIYVDRDGYLLEGTTSNLFIFRDGELITPPCDRVLPGITRQVVLHLAKKVFPVVERSIHKDEIRLLDEALITSSVREVVPVTAIDGNILADGSPGKLSRRVMELFADYTNTYKG